MTYEIIRLADRPAWKESAVQWFHEKWGIPREAYRESMEACLEGRGAVPNVIKLRNLCSLKKYPPH